MHEHDVHCFRAEQSKMSKRRAEERRAIESRQAELRRQEIAICVLLDFLRQRQDHIDSRLAILNDTTAYIASRTEELVALIEDSKLQCNAREAKR